MSIMVVLLASLCLLLSLLPLEKNSVWNPRKSNNCFRGKCYTVFPDIIWLRLFGLWLPCRPWAIIFDFPHPQPHPFISPACSALTLLASSFCLRLSALLMAEKRRMLRMTRETQGTRWTQITRNLDMWEGTGLQTERHRSVYYLPVKTVEVNVFEIEDPRSKLANTYRRSISWRQTHFSSDLIWEKQECVLLFVKAIIYHYYHYYCNSIWNIIRLI